MTNQTAAQIAFRAELWKQFIAAYQVILISAPETFADYCAKFRERWIAGAAIILLFVALAPQTQAKNKEDFSLVLHVTAVDMVEGTDAVTGGGSTDFNGNYSSHVSGGGSYTWHLFTARIDGDKAIYQLSTPRVHLKGGKGLNIGLAMATGGASLAVTARRNAVIHIGDYHARWNKDGSIEIELFDEKGKSSHQTFRVESEKTETAR